MIWQNAWAWFGALTIALPIAIHLLGRGHAKVLRFPSLRFFSASRLLPTRRTRIHDPWVLALRAAILIAAAAALAQPLFERAAHVSQVQRRLVRAILVDTSASMRIATDSVNRTAARLAREAQDVAIVRTSNPWSALASAAAWVQHRSGRREIIIVSDFRRSGVDPRLLAELPSAVGVRLVRVRTNAARSADLGSTHVDIGISSVTARWLRTRDVARAPVGLLASTAERVDAEAALSAAQSVVQSGAYDASHSVSIVFPSYPGRASIVNGSPPREPWMTDLLARLGTPTAARQSDSSERASLFLLCDAPAASVTCATLIAGVLRANTTSSPAAELDPDALTDADLARWQRPPGAATEVRRAGDWLTGPSDARWLWALVLVLLVVETVVRREPVPATDVVRSEADDRAA